MAVVLRLEGWVSCLAGRLWMRDYSSRNKV